MKLLIKTAVFTDRIAGCQQCWSVVKDVAAEMGIPVIEAKTPFTEDVRRVVYYDTPNMDLTKKDYIIRQRIRFVDGQPCNIGDLTLKYRTAGTGTVPDDAVVTAPAYKSFVSYQQDLAGFVNGQLGKNVGEMSVSRTIKKVPAEMDGNNLAFFAGYFPSLDKLGISLEEALFLINGKVIKEYRVSPGELDFGDGMKSGPDFSIWYDFDFTTGKPMVAELSFKCPFGPEAPAGAVAKAEAFFGALQMKMSESLEPGKMKVKFVFDAGLAAARADSGDE